MLETFILVSEIIFSVVAICGIIMLIIVGIGALL